MVVKFSKLRVRSPPTPPSASSVLGYDDNINRPPVYNLIIVIIILTIIITAGISLSITIDDRTNRLQFFNLVISQSSPTAQSSPASRPADLYGLRHAFELSGHLNTDSLPASHHSQAIDHQICKGRIWSPKSR